MPIKFRNLNSLEEACQRWKAKPILAFVADFPAKSAMHIILMELERFKVVASHAPVEDAWALPMNRRSAEEYLEDPDILSVTLKYPTGGWNRRP